MAEPARPGLAVLALGAWLKNAACRLPLHGPLAPRWSPLHGDLGDPQACAALADSVAALQGIGPVAALAHDSHPDFFSTRLAHRCAAALGVPAIAVQHHHAHIAAVLAEHGHDGPVLGLALDGYGLGSDGQAWGGELLWLDGPAWQRLGHLAPLPLPGGDAAAREPWRMAAAALHASRRGDEIEPRLAAHAGAASARGVAQLLRSGLNCPPTSSAGRWFDAAAGALAMTGRRQAHEAEAAIALEAAARRALAAEPALATGRPEPVLLDTTPPATPRPGAAVPTAAGRRPVGPPPADAPAVLDLHPLLAPLWALTAGPATPPPASVDRAAAGFHLGLADALAGWVAQAARRTGVATVVLGGGCFANRVLLARLLPLLAGHGLRVLQPLALSCGDAALALGQAWVARQQLRAGLIPSSDPHPLSEERTPCA